MHAHALLWCKVAFIVFGLDQYISSKKRRKSEARVSNICMTSSSSVGTQEILHPQILNQLWMLLM